MTVTQELATEIQKLAPSARIEMFEVDLSGLGDTVYYFHAGTNKLQQSLVWQGNTYVPWPAQASGFDYNTTGQLPRPKLMLANANGTITALVLAHNDCVGGKVTRRRTLAKFLDAVNFTGGVNPSEDPDACFPDEIYYIDRKATETPEYVEFELTAPFDVTGVKLPRRQIIQNLCPWRYRGGECGYAGPPIATESDAELTIGDTITPLEETYIATRDAFRSAVATATEKRVILNDALNVLNVAGEVVQQDDRYQRGVPKYYIMDELTYGIVRRTTAYYNNVKVTVGSSYRRGTYVIADSDVSTKYYRIQRWGSDTGAISDAQNDVDTAQAAYDAAVSAQATAATAYQAALAALPLDTPMLAADVCGKRVSSCKVRFGENAELPFGGFPGAGLVT